MLFGIFIYDGVEPIDLATYGVLSMAKRVRPEIEICTIAPAGGTVALANGLRVVADHAIASTPALDMLVVTGGPGWAAQSKSSETLAFIRRQAAAIPVVSVCTGGMILAASGVLDGKPATTKREVVPPEVPPIDLLRRDYPQIAAREALLVDAGSVVTGGGVSLCIDTMLHVLKRIYGADVAAEIARIIEYQSAWAANQERLPPVIAGGPSMSLDLDAFYRTLAHESPDAVVYADAEGLIRFWNKGAERIFGFSAEEAVGRSLDLIIPERLRERHWQGYRQVMQSGHSRYGAGDLLSVPGLRKDGTRVSLEFTIVPFAGRDGRLQGIAAILRDVTARFEELQRLRKELAGRSRGP